MKNKMKKMLSGVVLSLAVLSGVIIPKDANAYLVLGGSEQWRRNWHRNGPAINSIYVIGCLYLLPFCLLDEKNSSTTTTVENLMAQGFTAEEVDSIQRDQKLLTQRLLENNMVLEVRGSDSRETIRKEVLSIAPEVSDLYLNFLLEMKGL